MHLILINTKNYEKSNVKPFRLVFCCYFNGKWGGVVITTYPGTSNGYLCWEAVVNANYQVLVLERNVDTSMNVTYDTLETFYPTQNYLRFDQQYMNSSEFYYKVNILNSLGEVEDDSDFEPHCLYCPEEGEYLDACYWKCNGTDYSWNVTLAQNEAHSNGRLMVSTGFNYIDGEYGVGVPFFEPMTFAVFDAKGYALDNPYESREMYNREGVLSGEGIRDADNNILTGDVYFVEKKLEQFAPLSSIYTDILVISEADCGKLRPWAINTYNTYPESTLPIDLECTDAFGNYPDDPNDENDGSQPNEDWWVEIDELWEDFDPTINDLLNGLPGLAADGQSWVRVNEVSEDFSFIYISKIDGGSFTPVIIDPEIIFNNGDNYIAPSQSFPTGLYQVIFGWENGSVLPLVFEHDSSTYVPVTNAVFADLSIAPNPIQNNNLALEISVERKMNCTLQILSLSGATLYTEQLNLDIDTTLQKNIAVSGSNFPYNQLVVKLIFADGSSLQEIAIKP